jgi:hypothetical protein
MMKQIPTLQHVKGHKDSNTEYAALSLEAQLNVDVLIQPNTHGFLCCHPIPCNYI